MTSEPWNTEFGRCCMIYYLQSIVYFWSLKSILEALHTALCQLELGFILSMFFLNIANMINETNKKIGAMMIFFSPISYGCNAKGSLENNFYPHPTTRGRKCTFRFLSYTSSLASNLFPQDFQLQNKHRFCANCINNLNFNSFSVVPFVIVPQYKNICIQRL